jgi:hypothetical protein
MEEVEELPEDPPDPADVRLNASVERVRLIAASASGDAGALEYAQTEYLDNQRMIEAQLADPDQRPPNLTDEQIAVALRTIRMEAAWVYLWVGFNIDEAQAIFHENIDQAENPLALSRFEAMLRMRRGDVAAARDVLQPLVADDPLARIGLGIAAELEGDPRAAADIYAELSKSAAGALAGAWARARHKLITGEEPPKPDAAERLAELAAATPDWLEGMVRDTGNVIAIRTDFAAATIGVLTRPSVRINIQNVSNIPLAIGPEKPINSQVLLSPSIQIGVQKTPPADLATIVRSDRRLRLMPGEELTIHVDPTLSRLGSVLNQMSGRSARIRWRVLQGFIVNESGSYTRGPLGLAVQTPMLYRTPSPIAGAEPEQLEAWVRTGTARDVAEVVLALRWRAREPGMEPLPEDELRAIGAALAERYLNLDRVGRLLVLTSLPMSATPPWLDPLDETLLVEEDPDLALIALVIRASGPESALLANADESDDERLRAAAIRLRERWPEGTEAASAP